MVPMVGVALAAEATAAEAARADVGAGTGDGGKDEVAGIATEVVVRQLGLKCSTPIYDRGRNLLGNVSGSRDGRDGQRQQAAAPSGDKSGGTAGEGGSTVVLMFSCVPFW